ncbi:hypothetical protein FEE95_01300 [Maribacter algarum]|uniref:Arabinogalactan endo-beta-1,4-galactanase n=1 Tax=Maribacter algarum (ex Zhang et al. 2020) TaxID=2578118 RepID=A0A5S3PSX7_9FLAO|nr:hypothetical protein [Maribacter algarum]TMM58091.1 hypothetical protein FEE95_01300 [Maribacter algarum]
MKPIRFVLVFLYLLSCSKDNKFELEQEVETRSFYMGFTAFPYDLSKEAQLETYQKVTSVSDIFLTHLDHGVPWDEALNDLPFPTEVQNTLDATKSGLATNTKILLTATPTDQLRKSLNGYWNNEGSHQLLPVFWQGKSFDDPDVIAAYIKYCKRVIESVQPDYFAYAIEANAAFRYDDAGFENFLSLAETVYISLKSDYPDLPIFLTLQDRSFENTHQELLETSKRLLQHSDYVAMSTYPFLDYSNLQRDANPDLFEDNWLQDFRNLDSAKPFAISETGFCAEDLTIPNLGVNIKASETWQNEYMNKLFNSANNLNAEFVAWFVFRDYDQLYDKTPNPPDILKVWRDNGLLDGAGNQRQAYQTWRNWKAFEKK